jgi:hypothetical protein
MVPARGIANREDVLGMSRARMRRAVERTADQILVVGPRVLVQVTPILLGSWTSTPSKTVGSRRFRPTRPPNRARRLEVEISVTGEDAELRVLLLTLGPKARDDVGRALIHDQVDRDAIASQPMRFRD